MIELEQAIALVTGALSPQIDSELVPLAQASGRVTACALKAPLAVPNFVRSAMDGYAVYATDVVRASPEQPRRLTVLGTIYAGDHMSYTPRMGTAVRVMTGAAIPPGYDAVVKQELTDQGQAVVQIYQPIKAGKNLMPIGEDIISGQVVFEPYTYLNGDSVGILASLGYTTVPVLRRLRVGLIATGNELVTPGQPLAPNQIYNSTIYSLAAYIERNGGQVVLQTICQDNPTELMALLMQNKQKADLFITTGGISVGAKDFIPATLTANGGQPLFHFVNLRPGTPIFAANWQHKLILSLSGNPFAAMVNFHLFYWPLLVRFQRNEHFNLKKQTARLVAGKMPATSMRRFVRAKLTGTEVVIDKKGHYASVLHNMIDNNCLIEQIKGKSLQVGDQVTVYSWPD